MKRGRPPSSVIRENIKEILFFLGKGYGYDIYKIYVSIFPKVSMRSIYYHLKKGIELGEFEIEKIEKEIGDYSWGEMAEKTYYKLGKLSKPKGDSRVKKAIEKIKKDGE